MALSFKQIEALELVEHDGSGEFDSMIGGYHSFHVAWQDGWVLVVDWEPEGGTRIRDSYKLTHLEHFEWHKPTDADD